jgi:GLPGLI family protein
MKNFLFIILIFNFYVSFSQIKGGEAIYKIILQEKNPKFQEIDRANMKEILLKAEDEVANLRPKLKFNNNSSVFYIDESMNIEVQMAATLYCGCEPKKYSDLKNGKNLEYNSGGPFSKDAEFLIEDPIKKNWKIEGETKIIDKYTVIKATQVITVDKKPQTVIAWFCPELPFPFGPKGYGGLPGLILELRIDKVVFGIEKIELSQNDVIIKVPTKGEKITSENYNKTTEKRIDDYKKEN